MPYVYNLMYSTAQMDDPQTLSCSCISMCCWSQCIKTVCEIHSYPNRSVRPHSIHSCIRMLILPLQFPQFQILPSQFPQFLILWQDRSSPDPASPTWRRTPTSASAVTTSERSRSSFRCRQQCWWSHWSIPFYRFGSARRLHHSPSTSAPRRGAARAGVLLHYHLCCITLNLWVRTLWFS